MILLLVCVWCYRCFGVCSICVTWGGWVGVYLLGLGCCCDGVCLVFEWLLFVVMLLGYLVCVGDLLKLWFIVRVLVSMVCLVGCYSCLACFVWAVWWFWWFSGRLLVIFGTLCLALCCVDVWCV